jgi:hypothetical protein
MAAFMGFVAESEPQNSPTEMSRFSLSPPIIVALRLPDTPRSITVHLFTGR